MYYVILAFYFQHCHKCTMRIYRTPGQFLFGTVNQGIFKTCESLVSCMIWTWSYTNKGNVHLYHNSMAATSRLRELNRRGTIAHNISNLFCRYLIFYDQVRYTAWFFYVKIFFIFIIIEVILCSLNSVRQRSISQWIQASLFDQWLLFYNDLILCIRREAFVLHALIT